MVSSIRKTDSRTAPLAGLARLVALAALTLAFVIPRDAQAELGATVSPRDGLIMLEQTDLVVPGPGAAFVLTRKYQGAKARTGPFGPGWSFPFDVIVRRMGEDLLLVGGNGDVRALERDPRSGYFWGLPGDFIQIDAGGTAQRRYVTGERVRFDAAGRIAEVAGRNPNITPFRFQYGATGHLENVVVADGKKVTFTYDAAGRIVRVASAGVAASYKYDGPGRLAEVVNDEGLVTRYRYDARNQMLSVEEGDGHSMAFEYDSAGRVRRRAWADGRWERFTYDAPTVTTRIEYPDGFWFTVQYARNGQQETVRDSLGHQEVTEYNADGALIRSVDAAGVETTATYDELGRLLTSKASSGLSVEREYMGGTDLVTRVDTIHWGPSSEPPRFVAGRWDPRCRPHRSMYSLTSGSGSPTRCRRQDLATRSGR